MRNDSDRGPREYARPTRDNEFERSRKKTVAWLIGVGLVVSVVAALMLSDVVSGGLPRASLPEGSPQYSPAPTVSDPSGPAGAAPADAALPALSDSNPAGGSYADAAYCRNEGTLIHVGRSQTFRGAFCRISGSLKYIGLNRAQGGTIVLDAVPTADGYMAAAPDATYTYTPKAVTIVTRGTTFQEPTNAWLSPSAPDLAHPGDLGLSVPISYPACDDSAIVIYGTAWEPATGAAEVQKLLHNHPGASYLRTDLSCGSFAGPSQSNSGGSYVYAVYSNVGKDHSVACRSIREAGTYGRWLSNTRTPANNDVGC